MSTAHAKGFSSTNRYRSPFIRTSSKEFSDTEISEHSEIENERISASEAQILTCPLPRSTKSISALIARASLTDAEDGLGKIVHLSRAWKLLHLSNFNSASSDELMFLSCIAIFGAEKAIDLASKHGWRCLRPLLALLLWRSERGKNYSARRPKRKPLSGSS